MQSRWVSLIYRLTLGQMVKNWTYIYKSGNRKEEDAEKTKMNLIFSSSQDLFLLAGNMDWKEIYL